MMLACTQIEDWGCSDVIGEHNAIDNCPGAKAVDGHLASLQAGWFGGVGLRLGLAVQ